jgi:phosphate transport system substrate-binding protein
VLLLPITAGSIAICYNVPGGPENLKLSRRAYLDIFTDRIHNWNDPAIAEQNPGITLPDLQITVVKRGESSGTTAVFTNHLNAISGGEFEKRVGKPGKSADLWPKSFIAGKGNAGVAAWISQTPGAVGYLELGYAELLHLPTAQLENKSGKYIAPSLESGQAALAGVKMPKNLVPKDGKDPAGPDAYPIVTYTWLLCWKNYGDPKKSETIKQVLRYCVNEGQQYSTQLGYIPLPAETAALVREAVETIKP